MILIESNNQKEFSLRKNNDYLNNIRRKEMALDSDEENEIQRKKSKILNYKYFYCLIVIITDWIIAI